MSKRSSIAKRREGRNSERFKPLDFFTAEDGRVDCEDFCKLEHLYQHSPSCQAARVILHSQLMSGGLQFTRRGKRVQMTSQFTSHVQKFWEPFATKVIDSFLKWGVCPVTIEEEENEHGKKLKIPYVPETGTFFVTWTSTGRNGFRRVYNLRATADPSNTDDEAKVYIRQAPDRHGTLNSPVATVAPICEFVESLQRLAEDAEHVRAAPSIVTQLRNRNNASNLDAGALFYDTETRDMHASSTERESTEAARALQMQARLCRLINDSQTQGDASGAGVQKPVPNQGPPPRLFTLPKDHEVAPHTVMPQTRNDLEALMRLTSQSIAASMGVPSSLILESRHTTASTQQLHLLNGTVSQLASSVASILTQTYHAAYGTENPVEVELNTRPMIDSSDLIALYTSGMIDLDTALPSALTLLGESSLEIDEALSRVSAAGRFKRPKAPEEDPPEVPKNEAREEHPCEKPGNRDRARKECSGEAQ